MKPIRGSFPGLRFAIEFEVRSGLIGATVCLLSGLAGAILSPVDGPLSDGLAAHHPDPGEILDDPIRHQESRAVSPANDRPDAHGQPGRKHAVRHHPRDSPAGQTHPPVAGPARCRTGPGPAQGADRLRAQTPLDKRASCGSEVPVPLCVSAPGSCRGSPQPERPANAATSSPSETNRGSTPIVPFARLAARRRINRFAAFYPDPRV